MPKVLRPLKSGGFSYCSSPEDKVGQGRCQHLPGIVFKQKTTDNGCTCVEIDSIDNNTTNIPKSMMKKDELDTYTKQIAVELDDEKKKRIIDFFNKKF